MCLQEPQEDYSRYSPLYRALSSYRIRDIQSRWGLSLPEFLDLPREFVTLMTKIADREMVEKNSDLEDIEKRLNKEQ